MNQLEVIKIWGENAGTDLETTVQYVSDNQNNPQVLVVSAMRSEDLDFNTTDKLKLVAQYLTENNLLEADDVFNSIINFHIEALKKQSADFLIPEIREIFLSISESFESNIWVELSNENDFTIDVFWKPESLLWLWEKISALVHTRLLEKSWVNAEMVDMENIIINKNQDYREVVIKYFIIEISRILSEWKVPVVWGFIANIPGGILENINRGYTDATASIVALSQKENYEKIRLNIFKSVDWILWVDPRLFPKGSKINLISRMDYLTARELTGGSIWWKAKFLHEYALSQDIMDAWVELKIMDPKKPNLWTTVSAEKNTLSHWVEIVNKRDGISFVRITKAAFSEGIGDVQKIFDIVKSKWFSIDMITTSETQVSFSLDVNNQDDLDNLKSTLINKFFNNKVSNIDYVDIQRNMSLIHCIWQNLDHEYQLSLAYGILALEKENIKIHTFWWEREKGAIIFAVEQKDAINSLQILAKQFNLVKEINEI
jgi:aspartokinase